MLVVICYQEIMFSIGEKRSVMFSKIADIENTEQLVNTNKVSYIFSDDLSLFSFFFRS